MSVNYEAKIGIGYIISKEERNNCNWEKEEEYFHRINGYDDESPIFFGIWEESSENYKEISLEDMKNKLGLYKMFILEIAISCGLHLGDAHFGTYLVMEVD